MAYFKLNTTPHAWSKTVVIFPDLTETNQCEVNNYLNLANIIMNPSPTMPFAAEFNVVIIDYSQFIDNLEYCYAKLSDELCDKQGVCISGSQVTLITHGLGVQVASFLAKAGHRFNSMLILEPCIVTEATLASCDNNARSLKRLKRSWSEGLESLEESCNAIEVFVVDGYKALYEANIDGEIGLIEETPGKYRGLGFRESTPHFSRGEDSEEFIKLYESVVETVITHI